MPGISKRPGGRAEPAERDGPAQRGQQMPPLLLQPGLCPVALALRESPAWRAQMKASPVLPAQQPGPQGRLAC